MVFFKDQYGMGPLLFNLFINDLPYFINYAQLRLYADDITLLIIKQCYNQELKASLMCFSGSLCEFYCMKSLYDSSLSFKGHIKSVCNKVDVKVAALMCYHRNASPMYRYSIIVYISLYLQQ